MNPHSSLPRRQFLLGSLAASLVSATGCGGGPSLPDVVSQSGPTAVLGVSTAGATTFTVLPFQHQVRLTLPDGRTSTVGRLGRTPGCFNFPVGVATLDRHAYVVETGNHRVQVLDASGQCVGRFGEGLLNYPGAISVRGRRVWVSDSRNARLLQFDADGRLLASVGEGVLSAPRGMDWQGGELFVADPGRHRVQVFDASGRPRASLGSSLRLPWDVALDRDLIYVADAAQRAVTVLNRDGDMLESISLPASPRNLGWVQGQLAVAS